MTLRKRRNPSSRSEGPQRKNKGPERQVYKRGLPSSSNSNGPFNKKLEQSEASIQQRETGPYHLRPRNRFIKEAGSRSSGVDNLDISTDTRVTSSWSRSRGTDDPAVKVQDKVDNPKSTQDSKIARKRMEGQRVGGPQRLKSSLEMSRTGESIGQVVLLH
ncbi:hypothetical protein TNCV_3225001 [Trichonephila clavipes]|nr:hypothetical protein TNCV_3225001 [Trichonephila clavipes]